MNKRQRQLAALALARAPANTSSSMDSSVVGGRVMLRGTGGGNPFMMQHQLEESPVVVNSVYNTSGSGGAVRARNRMTMGNVVRTNQRSAPYSIVIKGQQQQRIQQAPTIVYAQQPSPQFIGAGGPVKVIYGGYPQLQQAPVQYIYEQPPQQSFIVRGNSGINGGGQMTQYLEMADEDEIVFEDEPELFYPPQQQTRQIILNSNASQNSVGLNSLVMPKPKRNLPPRFMNTSLSRRLEENKAKQLAQARMTPFGTDLLSIPMNSNKGKQFQKKKMSECTGGQINAPWGRDEDFSKEDLDNDLDAYMANASGGLAKVKLNPTTSKSKEIQTDDKTNEEDKLVGEEDEVDETNDFEKSSTPPLPPLEESDDEEINVADLDDAGDINIRNMDEIKSDSEHSNDTTPLYDDI